MAAGPSLDRLAAYHWALGGTGESTATLGTPVAPEAELTLLARAITTPAHQWTTMNPTSSWPMDCLRRSGERSWPSTAAFARIQRSESCSPCFSEDSVHTGCTWMTNEDTGTLASVGRSCLPS